jgi:HAD superfamily hydrolase (TIGR01458 family)
VSEGASRGPIEGLLLDMDGVLTVSWKPIDGALDAMTLLRERGVPFRIMTNTTSHSRADLSAELRGAGFDVSPQEILTAPAATAGYLRAHHPGARVYLLGETGVAQDLDGVDLVDDEPADVVVIGGADEAFTFHTMNVAFRMLRNGAAMVAMHRNFSWLTDEGLCLDAGAYVVGLEAATGLTAAITGKPSPDFFGSGLDAIGLPPERAAMVGDDLHNDVLAAQSLGMTGVLTRTGKFRQDDLDRADDAPDHVVDSIADVPSLLGLV